jgi:GT2 family glycosyltransferase
MPNESNPVIRVRRRLGRVKRWMKRRWWERLIGREYRAWLRTTSGAAAGSVENSVPIAVIVAVYNPPVPFLKECVQSVVNQTATRWQLIVTDDGSTDPDVHRFLDDFASIWHHDARVTVLRGPNRGISAAQNHALDEVTCDYFGWLDHDDVLHPQAIELFSAAVAGQSPRPLLVYSDEDKIDPAGRHFELYCKPDFSPELLLSQMYLCHFTVIETSAVRQIGGFRSEMDGAQDFDLVLRLLPDLVTGRVVHIPLPLYHWRAWAQSTAESIEAKPWALDATMRAQRDHLARSGRQGDVRPGVVRGLSEFRWEAPSLSNVSVVIPTAGARDPRGSRYVDAAVASLRANGGADLEIIIVTTGDIEPVPGADLHVPYGSDHFNFARAVNLGCGWVERDFVVILNDDTQVEEPGSVSALLELAQLPGVGAVGAKLIYPNGTLQHVGMVLLPSGPTHAFIGKPGHWPGYFGSTLTPRNVSAVTAAAMLVPMHAFRAVGGFDETFARDFNDVDFCLRLAENGYRVVWTPYACWVHHEGVSLVRRTADEREARVFRDRWNSRIPDPHYSPALHDTIDRLYEAR